jgi:MFS transporter, ACS family, hexuronate transporter
MKEAFSAGKVRSLPFFAVQTGHYFALAFFIGAGARILWAAISDSFWGGKRKGVLLIMTWMELLSLIGLSLISFFPALAKFLLLSVVGFGISGVGWNAIYLTGLGEATDKDSTGMATAIRYFFGFLGSLVCPPLFGLLVDSSGGYGYGWLFLYTAQ